MHLLFKKAHGIILCIVTLFASAPVLAANLDIINGNLVDNRTGLVWMPLLSEQGSEPPPGFRGAFFNEINSILPIFEVQTITMDSDIAKAFVFFTSTLSVSQSGCGFLSGYIGSGSSCLSGWYFDQFTPNDLVYGQPHNYLNFALTPIVNAIDSSLSTTEFTFTGSSTLGPYYYSPSYTPDGNNWVGFGHAVPATRPLFVVSGVPEPTSIAMLSIGLVLIFAKKRHSKSKT